MIIDEMKLKEKILAAELLPIKVQELEITNKVVIISEPEDKYLEFVASTESKYLFFYYTYYEMDKFIIPYEWYSDYSKAFKAVVHDHNGIIKNLDFNTPKGLTMFVLLNGTYVGVEYEDLWLGKLEVNEAEEEFEKIQSKFNHEVKTVKQIKKDQKENDIKTFRELILSDPIFANCKNLYLRYDYMAELLEKDEVQQYKYLIEPYGIPINGGIKNFMDETWRIFKNKD
jgi:hypothetical protein